MTGDSARLVVLAALVLAPAVARSASYTIPNSFTTGTTAVAEEVNENFDDAKTAIDDNNSRITTLEAIHAPSATPDIILDDTVATDSSPEARVRGNAVADDNGRIELMVEDGADGTYNSGIIVEATSGTTVVKLGAGSTSGANYIQIGENGSMTAQGSATMSAPTPSVNDNDTSVATTAFVQAETVAAGDVTGTIGGGLTIGANTVALSTDTTGNYVATIADSGSSEVTVTGSGSEGAAVTLGLAAGITRDAELSAYTTGTSTPTDGSTACNTGDMHLETDRRVIFYCADGSTDDWYGVQLLDDVP